MASHDQEAFLAALQIVNSSTVHGVLNALIELNVFDIIAKNAGYNGYLHPDEIVANLPTKNPEASGMLDHMLRLLTTHSIVKCKLVTNSGNSLLTRAYGLTSISQYLVQGKDGPCVAPFHQFVHHREMQDSWYKLKDAVLEGGIPFNLAHDGVVVYDYLAKDQHLADLLTLAMDKSIAPSMEMLLKMYKGFEGVTQVVDVGGAHGATLNCIVSFNPHVKGINFDLPHVVKDGPKLPGIDHVGGDMFVSVPKGDAIVLQRVLPDWNDEKCLKILKNCYQALPDSGKVVIMEMIHSELPGNDVIAQNASQMDILEMGFTLGGKQRTAIEFQMLEKKLDLEAPNILVGQIYSRLLNCTRKYEILVHDMLSWVMLN